MVDHGIMKDIECRNEGGFNLLRIGVTVRKGFLTAQGRLRKGQARVPAAHEIT
jgi:hypothetical protein